ncbi:O-antigen ligase family protein [Pedobacter sp. GR22-6]|uniref:O-antigen ligase family protein n=1 Tax=Pedobacter sp. GR22-6 TaxID=3127957 RepID=UPI00307F9580
MFFIKEMLVSKNLLIFYSYLFLTGLFSVLTGTNTSSRVLSQVVGISLVSLYYYNFFGLISEKISHLFGIYTRFATIISALGLIISCIHSFMRMEFMPVKSIMLEPAHFVTAVLPALYFQIKDKNVAYYWNRVAILLAAILLSGSSVGLLGLLLILFLIPKKINPVRIILPLIFASVFAVALYFTFPKFTLRIDDTVNSFVNKDVSGANLSSYSLISNYLVAYKSFSRNPVLGGGLGSHVITHDREIGTIAGSEEFTEFLELNSQDANSLMVRVVSELGLVGILIIFSFIIKYYSAANESSLWISRAVLIYFFCKLLREGHYFSPEMYFFIFAYWLNYVQNRDKREDTTQLCPSS